jgi:putative ABC transport system permease protein
MSAIGMAAGFAAAFAATRVVRSLLVGVSATDPLTFGSIAALFTIVAAVAAWVPAWRASRLDPIVAVREE